MADTSIELSRKLDGKNDEAWAPVSEFPGYSVSSLGRVASFKSHAPRVLKGRSHPCGYLSVCLRRDHQNHERLVHRIVAAAFVSSDPGLGYWVNHKNGDKTDNRAENLEWTTASENAYHAYRHGLQPSRVGSGNGHSKLDEAAVVTIRQQRAEGMLLREIAKAHGVGKTTIQQICCGRAWSHV